ncbi:DUF4082 domain-containing protein [Saccharothrix sp. 6-C]|uniref:DUF4082 domain-containing protein n=1 Tax=Saccharothrix sp. 6-C TaxID=2781735 RepID=UPI0019170C86|nr:DUF4082 domain-containing protein [Saccharothrix sp. 6-C]QQQ73831.1 DUF4082 domain-containing protein [Saccharothrix sp. 6-C]
MRKFLVVAAAALLLSAGTAHAADRPPQAHLYTPTTGGQVEVGEPVLVTGGGYDGYRADTLQDYQVSVDGGQTWDSGYRTGTVPLGGESGVTQALWAYVFTPQDPGVYTIVGRVNTDTAIGDPSAPRTLYVGVPAPTPGFIPGLCYQCGFHTEQPAVPVDEGLPLELGLRFRVDRPLSITHISTWRNGETPSAVRLWRGDGTLLAALPNGGVFPTPVPVEPGVEYVASFTSPRGRYATTEDVFPATVVKAPLVLPAHAGVYSYDGGFPTETWHDSHYWVSPLFQAR